MKFTIMAEKLKQILSVLNTVENEMRFELRENGLHVISVDQANAAMIGIVLDKSGFVEWEINEDIDIGVDIVKLKSLTNGAGKLSDITITINDKMGINFDGMNFKLSMINPTEIKAKPRVPELDLPIKTVIDLDIMKSALKGISTIDGDMVNIVTEGNELMIYSDSKDGLDSFKTDPIGIEDGCNFPKSESMYSLDYMNMLSLLSGEVSMKYNSNMPIVFEYEKDGMKLFYMTAPRISQDG